MPIISPLLKFSHVYKLLLYTNLHVHTVIACSLKSISILYSSLIKVLRSGTFEVNKLLFCKRGEIQSVPDCTTHLFLKIHIDVTVYLLNSLILGFSSHGYEAHTFMTFRL